LSAATFSDDIGIQPTVLKYHYYLFINTFHAALWLILGVLYSTSLHAGIGHDRLQLFFDHLTGLKADFTQTVTDAHSVTVQNATGTLQLSRPGKFRWDYHTPYEQLIVADGIRVSVYDPELEQVTVKLLDKTIGNMPALLLSDEQPLENSFNITELGIKDTLEWLELTPKAHDTSFEKIRLAFNEQTLQAMELVDSFGQTTLLVFTHVQRNPEIDPSIFHFTPPADVDVIGDVDE